ncbi:legumain-like [Elysia marginata]|uniref:Legumain-like n=1 Tax=Elysia marginata TaxID=1093978 RepID=A0AAV4HLP6_9GAST|nr:legumain-like [Elysia marginata]
MKLPILLLLGFVSCAASGKNWAMLFTGAKGWFNYSTHSNLCHAYQVLHKAGIPDERIVVVMYNDIADNPMNPFPGKLFNNYNHTDVYKGTPMDYTGKEVTAELVLAALKGDKEKVKSLVGREGKVIDSGPEDNVFVAVSDHGGPGSLLMPDRLMSAKELNGALQYMHDNKKYANLVFYLESCESGSIFLDLPKNIGIYAITASNKDNPAYMNYCYDPDIKDVCIGGEFSTAWTQNSDKVNIRTFTLKQQSLAIEKAVNDSRPQLFGDLSLLKHPLKDFFGGKSASKQMFTDLTSTKQGFKDRSVPFHTMHLSLLKRKVEQRPADIDLRLRLARLQAMMADVDRFYRLAAKHVYPTGDVAKIDAITTSNSESIRNWDCYEAALQAVSSSCPGLVQDQKVQGYFLSKLSVLVNMCNRETGPVVTEAVEAASRLTGLCN